MYKLPRVHSPPVHKDWHLRFCGHICEVEADKFEEVFALAMMTGGPVIYEPLNKNPDDDEIVLDIYLDWIPELNEHLIEFPLCGFMLDVNEREETK